MKNYSNQLSFKRMFIGCSFGYLPLGVLLALLSLMGIIPVNVNNVPTFGLIGFVVMILFIPLVGLLLTVFTWTFYNIGVRIETFLLKTFRKENQ